jgi:hypothetical protein
MSENCEKLSNYLIEVAYYMFSKYGIVSNPIPYYVDYKLSMMIANLIYYECFLMFEPNSCKIDLWRLI